MREFRYSIIDTSYRCLRKVDLQYFQDIKPEGESADLHFGTGLHSALSAAFSQDDALGKVDPKDLFNQQWGTMKARPLKYSRGSWEDMQEHGEVFLEKFLRLHQKKFTPLYVEKEIKFKVGNYDFSGTPDFIGHVDGTLSIVDWKTAAYPYHKEKLELNEQMYLYAHAAKQAYGIDIKQLVYVVFVKNVDHRIQTIKVTLTEAKLKSMIDNVVAQCDLITHAKATNTLPMNRASCMMGERKCEYYGRCYGK